MIVDPTWTNEHSAEAIYLGTRFTGELALRLSLRSGWTSVFGGDAMSGNPILRNGLQMHNGIAIDYPKETL